MKKTINTLLCVAFALCVATLTSCGNGKKKELNHLLVELAATDHTIDHKDWVTIADYLNKEKADFADFYTDDTLDTEAVKQYISDFFAKRRPTTAITFIGVGNDKYLTVNFYLERSGSMTPYDAPNGDGLFKSAIVNMLNNLPDDGNRNKMYVVNSSINEYPQGLSQFLADNNVFEATKGIGDPSYTDFAAIFKNILQKTGSNGISILVTDMIYSTKNMQGVNAQKVLAEAEGMTNAVFKGRVKDLSTLIVKMHSSYNGPYYSYNATAGTQYDGQRPYYIIVVGSKDNMARLTCDNSYSTFSAFSQMRGYENEYLFETSGIYHPYYSLLLSHPSIKGRFQPERGQDKQVTSIVGMETEPDGDCIRLALAVDLGKMLIDDDYLTDPRNYLVEADDDIAIKQISKIDSKQITPAEKKYVGTATHIFVLETKKVSNEQAVKIRLLNNLPAWVAQSSADDDTDTHAANFAHTTFGLRQLLQGIYNSYKKNAQEAPYYFQLDLKFKN